jgi:hypothetical protein
MDCERPDGLPGMERDSAARNLIGSGTADHARFREITPLTAATSTIEMCASRYGKRKSLSAVGLVWGLTNAWLASGFVPFKVGRLPLLD